MRKYEAVYVLVPSLTDEQVQEKTEWVKSVIDKYGGETEEVESWGKKRLAYPINDIQEGFYTIVKFAGDKQVTGELERAFKLDEGVLRYLITRLDD